MINTDTTQYNPWPGAPTLDELRAQPTLVYRNFTVLDGTADVDGSLQTPDGEMSLPLDLVYVPAAAPRHLNPLHNISLDTDALTPDGLRDAVRGWCRTHLGRDDVQFEIGD